MAKYKILWLFVIVIVTGCDDEKGKKMNGWVHPKLEQFRIDINYDQSIKSIEPKKGVVADWSNKLILDFVKNPHFKVLSDSIITIDSNTAYHEWILGIDKPELEIGIFASSNGPQTAGSQLLGIASNTSMSIIPYQKGPAELGHLAIWDSDTKTYSLAWIFYNICFRLQKYENDTDLLNIARNIQDYCKKNIVPDAILHLPHIEKIELNREKLLVGEELRMEIICAKNIEKNRLVISPETESNNLSLTEEEDFAFTFEALNPGVGKVNVILTDKLNLLSSHKTVEIEIKK